METALIVLSSVSIICSLLSTLAHIYFDYKKSKEPPKDDVWETTTRILCASGSSQDADDFAMLYQELKWFKEHGGSLHGENSIHTAMKRDSGNNPPKNPM